MFDVLDRQRRVHAAFESMTRVGREVESARTARDSLGPPERGLDIDVPGVVGHCRLVTAHDACERLDRFIVGDHADLLVDLDRVAVQQFERLALAPPAHGEAAVNLVQIEDVRRAAEFEHHVVRDIDQRSHRTLAATGQTIDHPRRRLRLRVDVLDDASGEAAAQVGRLDLHAQLGVVLDGRSSKRGLVQR